jgi:hypothetical protein
MDSQLRTVVTFESTAFNMTEPKDYFINPCCFGDDVAEWLISELRKLGMRADEKPGQEDFGWYLDFEVAGIGHTFVVGRRPTTGNEAGRWVGWLERRHGFVRSLFGGRKRGIQPSAAEAIHRILTGSPQIRDVRWHFSRDFDRRREGRGASSPQSLALNS